MHKWVIILVEAESREDAVSNVRSFLECYGEGNVWDWYVVGGRRSGMLNKLTKEFNSWAKGELFGGKQRISTRDVEDNKKQLQDKRQDMGWMGVNPRSRDQYQENGFDDDVKPVWDCSDVIKEYCRDINKAEKEAWDKMIEEKKKWDDWSYGMSAYYARMYANANYRSFSFDCNVYDIDEGVEVSTGDEINTTNKYAVMIDMHN